MIEEEIKKANIEAMKKKDSVARAFYSVLMTKIMLERIARRESGKDLTDADVSNIIQKVIKELNDEKENYQKVITMCNAIIDSNETYEDIDINTYFEGMNRLRKEGFILKEVKTSKMKKILGAIVSSCVFSFLFLCLIGIISYFQLVESEKIPWVVYGIILLILFIPVFGMGKNLVSRIIEINKGEEDEASKY